MLYNEHVIQQVGEAILSNFVLSAQTYLASMLRYIICRGGEWSSKIRSRKIPSNFAGLVASLLRGYVRLAVSDSRFFARLRVFV